MNKKLKIIVSVLLILILGLIILTAFNYKNQNKKKSVKFNYINDSITINLYNLSENKVEDTFRKIKEIYKKYDKLIDKENSYEGINNLYYIIYNDSKSDNIKIDKDLYKMLKEGKNWYQKSDGLIDISMGSVLDIWKMYRDSTTGVPTIFELERAHSATIDDIVLLENNKIKNNRVSIDLDDIAKGYATKEVIDYLKVNKINEYLINIGESTITGNHYDNGKYKIAIKDLTNDEYKILHANNISIINTNINQNYYDYNNKHYHDLISPKTLMPANYFKGVTIITDDIKDSFVISKLLFLMPIDEGKKYVEEQNNLEAIWYIDEDKIEKSNGFSKYE